MLTKRTFMRKIDNLKQQYQSTAITVSLVYIGGQHRTNANDSMWQSIKKFPIFQLIVKIPAYLYKKKHLHKLISSVILFEIIKVNLHCIQYFDTFIIILSIFLSIIVPNKQSSHSLTSTPLPPPCLMELILFCHMNDQQM